MPSIIGQFWVPFFKKFTEWDSFSCNHFNIFFVDGDKLLDNVCYRYRLRPSSWMNHFGSTWWLYWSASWIFPMLVLFRINSRSVFIRTKKRKTALFIFSYLTFGVFTVKLKGDIVYSYLFLTLTHSVKGEVKIKK